MKASPLPSIYNTLFVSASLNLGTRPALLHGERPDRCALCCRAHQANQGERREQTGPGDGRAPPEGAGRLLAGGVYRWPRHLHIREHRQFPRPPSGTLMVQWWCCPGLSSFCSVAFHCSYSPLASRNSSFSSVFSVILTNGKFCAFSKKRIRMETRSVILVAPENVEIEHKATY